MSQTSLRPRKKIPKELAVIDADNCTGCQACVEVCPVDCIVTVHSDEQSPGLQSWCEIDWDRCIGCKLCIRLPGKKSEPYTLTVCPWGAIEMVPTENAAEAVEQVGGPAEYIAEHRSRLVQAARRQQSPGGQ